MVLLKVGSIGHDLGYIANIKDYMYTCWEKNKMDGLIVFLNYMIKMLDDCNNMNKCFIGLLNILASLLQEKHV